MGAKTEIQKSTTTAEGWKRSLPIGVADYHGLPPEVLEALPSVDELQAAVAEAVSNSNGSFIDESEG